MYKSGLHFMQAHCYSATGEAARKPDGSIEHKNATTEFDLTEKSITPMGGFVSIPDFLY